MYIKYFQRRVLGGLSLLFVALSPLSNANALYEVNVDTASLVNNAMRPFSLDFILYDGNGTGDGNNTIQLIDFNFGEGSYALKDTQPVNEIKINFPNLSRLHFRIDTTTNLDSPLPDVLIFRILDNAGNPIPTTAPTIVGVSDAFFAIALNSATGTVDGPYGTDPNASLTINPPEVRLLSPANIAEPATLLLLVMGLAGLLANWRLRALSLVSMRGTERTLLGFSAVH